MSAAPASSRLDNNELETLPEGIFTGHGALQNRLCFLSGNRLTSLPEGLFTGLVSLEELSLANNELETLTVGVFSGLGTLRDLQLQNNRLSALPAGVFDDLAALEVLYLGNNRLSALPAGVFEHLVALEGLRLENNPGSGLFVPVADAGADQAFEAERVVTLRAATGAVSPRTDYWGSNVVRAWTQIDDSGVRAELTGARTATASFVMPASAEEFELEFEFRVTGRGVGLSGARYIGTDTVMVRLIPDTVVTLSGPVPASTTEIDEDELRLLYVYSTDDLHGRTLAGRIEVAAAIDGAAVTPSVGVDEASGRGTVTIVLRREDYPGPDEHLLAVTLSLGAGAARFVLAEPGAVTTTFSFVPVTVLTLSGPVPATTTAVDQDELRLVYSYSADDLQGRALSGSIEVAAAVDGVPTTPVISVDEVNGRGDIAIVLRRGDYPDGGEHLLAVTLSLSAGASGFVLGEPRAITTTFSFLPVTVVTLAGPVPMTTTGIDQDELRLVYSYSADDLHGRALSGSIEVAAAVGGAAVTPSIDVDETSGTGEITIVLRRGDYPDGGEHTLSVTLSLSAGAGSFALGEPRAITTTFSFVPVTVLTLSGPEPMTTTAVDEDELRLFYSYSADELYGRALSGSIEVAAAVDGAAVTPGISVDETSGRGTITIVLRREDYPGPDERLLAVTLSLSAGAGSFVLGEPGAITTTFSFIPVTAVTLAGPEPMTTTEIDQDELRLLYSYSADDLQGRALSGSIEVAAAVDGAAVTPSIDVDETSGRGTIAIVLRRGDYPDGGEHLLAVTLSLSASASGFVLGEPGAITTTFSFVPVTVVTLAGPEPATTTEIDEDELRLVYSYSADELYGRALSGSIEVTVAVDGAAVTPVISVDEASGRGEIIIVLRREDYPGPDKRLLAVTLSLSAGSFVLGEPGAITTTFSFVPVTAVTLAGPEPMTTIAVDQDELRLVYSYSADDLQGRALSGSIEVAAAVDGAAVTPSIDVDETSGRGTIAIVLRRGDYPDGGEHLLAVTLSLSASASGFVLGEPRAITTTFSFVPVTVLTLSGPEPMTTTGIDQDELRLVYSYSADDLYGRALSGSVEVAAAVGGAAVTPSVDVDEVSGRGDIAIVLRRGDYPDGGEHLLAVTLSLSAGVGGFVLVEPRAITTTFSFVPVTVLTLSGPEPMTTTGVDEDELRLVYSYSADELYGRALSGSVEVATSVAGAAVDPVISVDEASGTGEIAIVLRRGDYPDGGEHLLSVTLSLSAGAGSFVLAEPGAITTTFSFVPVTVLTLAGPEPMTTTAVDQDELRLVYSYSADELYGRALSGSVEVATSVAGAVVTPSIDVDETSGRGEIAIVLRRGDYPDGGEHLLAVTLSLSAGASGFVLVQPGAITTTFSFVPVTVVTLSGPEPMTTTGVDEDELRLLYSYSADELYGRALSGSIEVTVAVDGAAVTPGISVDETSGRGTITIVLRREDYPGPDERPLAVTLSLSAGVGGFVLGEPGAITTTFSFVPVTAVTLAGPEPMTTTDIDEDELRLLYSYSADDLQGRALSGSIEVATAVAGAPVAPVISVDEASGRGGIVIVLRREDYPGAGDRLLTVSLRVAADGFVLGEPGEITTTFSFVPVTVLTLSGPEPMTTTDIDQDELRLVYSYSADDLRGRALSGSVEVAAAVDGAVVTPSIDVDETSGRGDIAIVLRRGDYPDGGEHLLAVTLSLSAGASGFVLGGPGAITTTFSFVPVTVLTLAGLEPMTTTDINQDELRLVYSYSADELYGRALSGSIEVAAAVDGAVVTPGVDVDETSGRGTITIVLRREDYPGSDERLLAVTLSLSAGAGSFVLVEPRAITTTFSFAPVTVLTLSGPEPMTTTDIDEDELRLVYIYSADELYGRALTGSVEVAAAVDGVPIDVAAANALPPSVGEANGRGGIVIVLRRENYPGTGERLLAVTLSLSAGASGFVLGEPRAITTTFSFVPVTVVTLAGPEPAATTEIDEDELRLLYSYSADDLRGRSLAGSVEAEAAIDGVPVAPAVLTVDEARGRGEISIVLRREDYPDGAGRLAVTLNLIAGASGFALGKPGAITTTFSFVPVTVLTLARASPGTTTGVAGDELRLLYIYSADDLHDRALAGIVKVAATVDGATVTPSVNVGEASGRGEIIIVLRRGDYSDSGEHLLAVTLSLSIGAGGFVLGGAGADTTTFSFAPVTVLTLAGPEPAATTDINEDELRLVYSYSADDLHGRALAGRVEAEAAVDGVPIDESVPNALTYRVDEANGRGEVIIVLRRADYPGSSEHLLVMTLTLGVGETGFVLGETRLITTPFSFSRLPSAIAEDGTCQLGVLEPGERCRYGNSPQMISVVMPGPRLFFFVLREAGEFVDVRNAPNPIDFLDFNIYDLEAEAMEESYRITRIYDSQEDFGSESQGEDGSLGGGTGSLDGATLLLLLLALSVARTFLSVPRSVARTFLSVFKRFGRIFAGTD